MAVSGSDISALRQQQYELERLIQSKSAEIDSVRRSIQAENDAKLRELRAETNERIQERDRAVRNEYQQILDRAGSETERRLEREKREYQQKYDQLSTQVRAAFAEEQRRTEALLIEQKNFEAAYYAHMEHAREEAIAVHKEASELLRHIAEKVPVEWFFPGRIAFYRDEMFSIERLIDNGLYEGAVGYAGGLVRDMKLLESDVSERFHRWYHYYSVLHGVLAQEKQLIFTDSRRVPDKYKRFCIVEGVTDNLISTEKLGYWSDGRYDEMLKRYAAVNNDLQQFFVEGRALETAEEVRTFMIKHPELSARLQENVLYNAGRDGIGRMERDRLLISRCYDRIGAFDERLLLGMQLKKALSVSGSSELPKAPEPGAPLVLFYRDDMDINSAEVIIVPVLRRSDDKWLNMAACYVSEGMGADSVDDLRHIIADVLVTKDIGVSYHRMKPGQTTGERIGIVSNDMQMKVNGRLN